MPRLPGVSGSLARIARPGQRAGAGYHRRAPGLHQHAAIGLLLVAHPDHVDHAIDVEELAGEAQGAAPLSRSRLRRDAFGAFLRVVVGLRDRRVGLVAAGGAAPFVLVVQLSRCVERLLPAMRAKQRSRPPQPVHVLHLFRDLDVPFGAHLLLDEFHREERREGVRPDGLHGARVQRRRHFHAEFRQVGVDIVPVRGGVFLRKNDFGKLAHGLSL